MLLGFYFVWGCYDTVWDVSVVCLLVGDFGMVLAGVLGGGYGVVLCLLRCWFLGLAVYSGIWLGFV